MKLPMVVVGILAGAVLGIVSLVIYLPLGLVPPLLGMCIGACVGGIAGIFTSKRLVIDEQSFGHLPKCTAEFITLVIKKMRYRKKVRGDVMAELAAHFEDELKDCTTDEEKEQKAKQLIEQFGDVELLAVLLRRAKKRCRPLWRTVVARTFQTIGVLILLFTAYTGWFLTGKPTVSVDYLERWNEISKPEIIAGDNAWPDYEKAIELFVPPDKKLEKMEAFKGSTYVSFGELNRQDQERIKSWVADNDSAWQQFVKASNKRYCYRQAQYNKKDKEKWLFSITLPELGPLRDLARLGIWRSRIDIDNGRVSQALDECLTVVRTGRFWQASKATMIEQLVGTNISNLVHNEILHILSRHHIDTGELEHIRQQLLDIYRDGYPTMNIEGEKLGFMDIVQHLFTDGGPGGGHLIPERMRWVMATYLSGSFFDDYKAKPDTARALLSTAWAMYHARRNKTIEKANEFYDYSIRLSKMTPYQRRIDRLISCRLSGGCGKHINIDSLPRYRYFLVSTFMPYLDGATELPYQAKALHKATITVLALERYKSEKGKYPDSLEQLKAEGYIDNLPMDPYTDKPLIYKKTDDNFVLYSVGPNFKDDGGQVYQDKKGKPQLWHDEFGDAVFWPVQKSEVKQ